MNIWHLNATVDHFEKRFNRSKVMEPLTVPFEKQVQFFSSIFLFLLDITSKCCFYSKHIFMMVRIAKLFWLSLIFKPIDCTSKTFLLTLQLFVESCQTALRADKQQDQFRSQSYKKLEKVLIYLLVHYYLNLVHNNTKVKTLLK